MTLRAAVNERLEVVRANGIDLCLHHFEPADPAATKADRRTLLLLHGFLDAAATFDLVAGPLALAGFEVIALDQRGFGASGWVGEGGYYHFADYIADLDDLTTALARPWLGVVGHSMGGGVATLFAGTRPERVKKLVVMEGLGPMADPPELAVDRMRRWLADRLKFSRTPRPIASMDEALTRLAVSHARLDRDLLRSRVERLVRRADDGTLTWAWDPLHRTTSPTPFRTEEYKAFLRAIACPVLYVNGGPLGWHPPDEDERLATIAQLERLDLPEAGHMMHWTAPEAVASRIIDFMG